MSSKKRHIAARRFLAWREIRFISSAALFLTLAACGSKQTNVIHQERSLYRNIYVTEEKGQRCMAFRERLKGGPQGCIFLKRPSVHALDYTKLVMAGLYVVPNPKRVLVIGLGVGAIPKTIQEMYPGVRLDTVELDPAVARIAASYFGYRPGQNARVIVDDGRRFVRNQIRNNQSYDVIFLDAFNADYIPEHLATAEFLTEVRTLLSPNGAVAANTWAKSKMFDSESATYKAVFGAFVSINSANRIILASKSGAPSVQTLTTNAVLLESELAAYGINKELILPLLDVAPRWNQRAPVLTDNYSPANLLNQ